MKNQKRIWNILPFVLMSFIVFMAGCSDDKEVNNNIIRDGDGYVYGSITIGSRTWLTENLKTTSFRDGTPITLIESEEEWKDNESPAYSWVNNDQENHPFYGGLYNGYAVMDSRGLCPDGWHVSTDADWKDLEIALGMESIEINLTGDRGKNQNVGGALKADITWQVPNMGATNTSGFYVLGSGYRRPLGELVYFNQWTGFYTSTVENEDELWMRYIGYDMPGIARQTRSLNYGYCIRCVKDYMVGDD